MLLARTTRIHFLLPSFLILPCWFSSDTTFLHSLQPLKREKCLDWHRLSPIVIGGRWSMNFHRSDGFLDFSAAGEIDNGSPPRLSSSSPSLSCLSPALLAIHRASKVISFESSCRVGVSHDSREFQWNSLEMFRFRGLAVWSIYRIVKVYNGRHDEWNTAQPWVGLRLFETCYHSDNNNNNNNNNKWVAARKKKLQRASPLYSNRKLFSAILN